MLTKTDTGAYAALKFYFIDRGEDIIGFLAKKPHHSITDVNAASTHLVGTRYCKGGTLPPVALKVAGLKIFTIGPLLLLITGLLHQGGL